MAPLIHRTVDRCCSMMYFVILNIRRTPPAIPSPHPHPTPPRYTAHRTVAETHRRCSVMSVLIEHRQDTACCAPLIHRTVTCQVTSKVFNDVCSDWTYTGHRLLCSLLTTMLISSIVIESRSQTSSPFQPDSRPLPRSTIWRERYLRSNDSFNFSLGLIKYIVIVLPSVLLSVWTLSLRTFCQ